MYTVLLVDDEPWTLIGIRESFNWERMGFRIVGETTDSEKALEMIYTLRPDAVFSDIRMGEISGLDLIKNARKKQIPAEFIFISGYAEFSYAQDALRWGAFDYWLKPIHIEEGKEILASLKQHLDKRNNPEAAEQVITPMDSFGALLDYITINFHKPIQLQALADMFYINFTYCSELFKKRTGKTFSAFVMDLRMSRAIEMMKVSDYTISGICEAVGYNNYPHFCRLFKRRYGLSPTDYRAKLTQEADYAQYRRR